MSEAKSWILRAVTHESLLFQAPWGPAYSAECVAGNFQFECEHAFGFLQGRELAPGGLRAIPLATLHFKTKEERHFEIEFPAAMQCGPCVKGENLRGFVIVTPQRRRIAMFFSHRYAPIELKGVLTALCEEQKEEDENGDRGSRQLRQEPVSEPGAAAEEDGDRAEGLQGLAQHGGLRQAGGGVERQRGVEEPEGVLEVDRAELPKAGLLAEFTAGRKAPPPPPAIPPTPGTRRSAP